MLILVVRMMMMRGQEACRHGGWGKKRHWS